MTRHPPLSLGDTASVLPEFLRRTLARLDTLQGWTLIVRHAEREHFPPGSFGNDVSLTPHGRRQALELGARLQGRLAGATSSPLSRCTETSRLVSAGAGHHVEPSTDRLLGDPGPFIEDAELSGRAFNAMSLKELVNRLLEPDTVPEGMRSADAGCSDLLALAREALPAPGDVHLMVTHDAILAPLLTLVAGERTGDLHWPDFLDGVALSWDGSDLLAVVGGELRRIGGASWREPDPLCPTTLWWLLTARCDLACHHCYLRGSSLPFGEMDTHAALSTMAVMRILPSGHVVPCCHSVASQDLMAGFHTLFYRPLREQLRSSLLCRKKKRPLDVRLTASGNEACQGCPLLNACELGCEVVAWHDHGDLKHHDSHHCQLMRTLFDLIEGWDYCENGHV